MYLLVSHIKRRIEPLRVFTHPLIKDCYPLIAIGSQVLLPRVQNLQEPILDLAVLKQRCECFDHTDGDVVPGVRVDKSQRVRQCHKVQTALIRLFKEEVLFFLIFLLLLLN